MSRTIPITCKGQYYLSIDELEDFQGNLKELSKESLAKLKESLLKYGFSFPVFVWRNKILDGHQRLFAVKELLKDGYTIGKIPVVEIEARDETEAAEKLLVLNSRFGKITEDGLAEFVKAYNVDIEGLLSTIEIPDVDIDEVLAELEDEEVIEEGTEDEVPEVDEEKPPFTQKDDVWILGEHRLLCGDATKREDVERLMAGEKADMVFTDPPYGMFLDTDFSDMEGIGKGNKYKPVKGDHEDFTPELILTVFKNFGYCKEIFLWGADYYAELIPNRNKGAWIVWDKMQGGEGVNDDYDKMFGSNFELCWSKAKHKRAIARVLWKGIFGLAGEDTKKRVHPTQKPVKLCLWFFEKFAKKGDVVVDLYGGSGTTLIACQTMGLKCRIIELDEHYCDIIVKRYIDFTGKEDDVFLIRDGKKVPYAEIKEEFEERFSS